MVQSPKPQIKRSDLHINEDPIDTRPFRLFPPSRCSPHLFSFSPVLDLLFLSKLNTQRGPAPFPSIVFRDSLEPSRTVLRNFSSFALLPRCALELLLLALELIGTLVLSKFEGSLVRAQSAISGWEQRFKRRWAVVQGNRVRCEVERC